MIQFRMLINASVDKQYKGGWVQTALDIGNDIPFLPNKIKKYYSYKTEKHKVFNVKTNKHEELEIDVYHGNAEYEMSDKVALIESIYTFFFIRITMNYLTQFGVQKNVEMSEYYASFEDEYKNLKSSIEEGKIRS